MKKNTYSQTTGDIKVGNYTLPKGDLNFKDVTNLLRRVGMRAKLKSNTLLYDTYDVKEGETPEMIAHKLYGDPELHWVILLINDITDRYHQWPMTGGQFLDYLNDKYILKCKYYPSNVS